MKNKIDEEYLRTYFIKSFYKEIFLIIFMIAIFCSILFLYNKSQSIKDEECEQKSNCSESANIVLNGFWMMEIILGLSLAGLIIYQIDKIKDTIIDN